jgi:hypothetical protein
MRLDLTQQANRAMLSRLAAVAAQFPTINIFDATRQAGLDITIVDQEDEPSTRPQSAQSLANGMGTLEMAM